MNPQDPLSSVFFIKLPEDFSFTCKTVKIKPEVLLPVQKKDGEETLNLKELTEEQILSGILLILAYDTNNENLDYYRTLLLEARPNIKKELGEAAILKAKNEDWEFAEEIWLSLHGLDPQDKVIILNMALFYDQRADSYRNAGLIDDADAYDASALANYKKAMDSDVELPDAFFNAGFFYLKKQNFKEAKGCFESYLALTADFKDAELGENGIYKKERAQELINKIANRNLEDDTFHKAYELISSGKEEEGLDEIRKFITNNPYVWNAWFMLGWGLRRLERFEDAKKAFLKAQECEGGDENADTLNELAICQIETGEIEEAKQTLYEALKLDGDNTKIISNLGFVCLKTGDKEQAKKFFMTVLEIDPNDKIAKAQLEQME